MTKLCIGIPCSDVFYKPFVASLIATLLRLREQFRFSVITVGSCYVHRNRNHILADAASKDIDYLLFVDADTVWMPEDITRLTGLNKPVACGWYLSRKMLCGEEHAPILMKREPGGYKLIKDIPSEPFTCDATGAGFMLLKKDVVDKMHAVGQPFDMMLGSDLGLKKTIYTKLLGEDMSFCYRLQQAGYEIWIDPSVKLGHANIEVIR